MSGLKMEQSETVTIPEAAKRLGIGRRLAYEQARIDALPVPVIRIGARMMVSRVKLDRLLAGERPTSSA